MFSSKTWFSKLNSFLCFICDHLCMSMYLHTFEVAYHQRQIYCKTCNQLSNEFYTKYVLKSFKSVTQSTNKYKRILFKIYVALECNCNWRKKERKKESISLNKRLFITTTIISVCCMDIKVFYLWYLAPVSMLHMLLSCLLSTGFYFKTSSSSLLSS